MKGDFSQWKFKGRNNINPVLHQQGRVLLDSDWNAQTRHMMDWQDLAGMDTIGKGVAGVPVHVHDSFKIQSATVDGVSLTEKRVMLKVSPGRIWVDGMLVQLPGKDDVMREAPYFQPPIQDPAGNENDIESGTKDAVVLEVWREALNAFQVPEDLLEPALGGPDTTERVLTSHAFRLYRMDDEKTCADVREKLNGELFNKGRLRVSLQPTLETDGDCPVVEGGGYTGFEHRLYRIEIAHTDDNIPRFKWSQFNGGLVGRGHIDSSGNIKITANLQPIITSGMEDCYLEIVEFDEDLGCWQVEFGCEGTLNHDEIELKSISIFGTKPGTDETFFFRLWDGICMTSTYAKPGSGSKPVELHQGIRVEFDNAPTVDYLPGDYWLFSVRTSEIGNPMVCIFVLESLAETDLNSITDKLKNAFKDQGFHLSDTASITKDGDVWTVSDAVHDRSFEIRKENGKLNVYAVILVNNEISHGPEIHRVPLAILNWTDGPKITKIHDCREIIRPLSQQGFCCTFFVGDGKKTHGDFDSINDAIAHLPSGGEIPEPGGQICLLPGEHEIEAEIKNREHIRFVGCYQKTLVKPKEPKTQKAIFTIQDSKFITFENMDLIHPAGIIFEMTGSEIGKLKEIDIHHTHMAAHVHAISVHQGQSIRINDNTIGMFDKPQGDVAIFMHAEDSVIRDNIIRIITVEDIPLPEDDTDPSPPNWRHPCIDLLLLLMNRSFIMQVLRFLWSNFFPAYQANEFVYQTPGGIQIGCGSERINILNNRIQGGWWNGITLGHLSEELKELMKKTRGEYRNRELPPQLADRLEDLYLPLIYDLKIEGNEILNMGLNGIGVVDYFEARIGFLVSMENMMICGNNIQYCLHQTQNQEEERFDLALGGVVLSDCEHLIIRENRIGNNGNTSTKPISGIYIHFGEKIDISDNWIVNNGSRQMGQFNNPVANLKKDWFKPTESGLCAGVVVRLVFKRMIYEFIDQQEYIRPDGIPAVKIHDNIIVQPQGQALFIGAFGPVSVASNTLTSQDANFKINPFSAVAGSVIILNLGISKDLIARYMFGSPKRLAQASYIAGKRNVSAPASSSSGGETESLSYGGPLSQPVTMAIARPSAIRWGLLPFLFCPSGNVLFCDNQVTLDLRSLEPNKTFSSQFIFTLDDLAYVGNQSECTSLIDLVINNSVLFGATLRSVGNRFQEGVTITKNSLFSFGLLMNSCSSNQATHCLIAMPFTIPGPILFHNIILYVDACQALLKIVEFVVLNSK